MLGVALSGGGAGPYSGAMPTRWLILASLVTGLAILVAGAVFFTMVANGR